MTNNPFADGLHGFAKQLRSGQITASGAVDWCLARIERHNPVLCAFELVDARRARSTAEALDKLLAGGTDLGPLMGVPIAVKDIIAVDNLPTSNGSLYASEHLTGPQGRLIAKLKRAGCIIVGKTRTVEFALGATGVNEARGTPWNPWDMETHRIPGGSSSGSAVAVAAQLCGFALGTDTGGSVRIPACYNGLFGHKTSTGLWPTDGIFPLSPTFDSVGPLTRTARDAALVHETLTGQTADPLPSLAGLRVGVPQQFFLDDLDPLVKQCFELALQQLTQSGVALVDVDLPEACERETLFPPIVGAELIHTLTAEGFAQARPAMDKVTAARAAVGLNVSASDYLGCLKRSRELALIADNKLAGLDAFVTPTCALLPLSLAELADPALEQRALLSSRNTQPINLFDLCAVSLPVQHLIDDSSLPCGLQVVMRHGQDSRLLSLAAAVQKLFGPSPLPQLS